MEYKSIYIDEKEDAVYGLEFDISLLPEDTSRELPWPQEGKWIDRMHYLGTIEEWMKQQKKISRRLHWECTTQ